MKKRNKYETPICLVVFAADVICGSVEPDEVLNGGPGGFAGDEQLFFK